MWRWIDVRIEEEPGMSSKYEAMCLHAVNLSQGGLEDIRLEFFGTDSMLMNIADRSSKLRRLRLVSWYSISDEGLKQATAKLALLDHLDISYCSFSAEILKAIGRSCPLLRTLKYNCEGSRHPHIEGDGKALTIAQNMPSLRYLQLFGNKLADDGLRAILDGCPHLEHVDLRQCFNVNLVGDLKKRCSERIKDLRQPNDPTDDYEFDATVRDVLFSDGDQDMFSSDEEYPYDYSYYDLMSDDDYESYYRFWDGSRDYSDYLEFMGFG